MHLQAMVRLTSELIWALIALDASHWNGPVSYLVTFNTVRVLLSLPVTLALLLNQRNEGEEPEAEHVRMTELLNSTNSF